MWYINAMQCIYYAMVTSICHYRYNTYEDRTYIYFFIQDNSETHFTNTTYDEINHMIDLLDSYLSGLPRWTLLIHDKSSNNPFSAHKWAKFTTIQMLCVNDRDNHSYGFLLGLSPLIHCRHHTATNWILYKLYNNLKQYLPEKLNCTTHLLFRSLFGIRSGIFRPTQKSSVHAFHIHSTTSENFDMLISAIHSYSTAKNTLPRVKCESNSGLIPYRNRE